MTTLLFAGCSLPSCAGLTRASIFFAKKLDGRVIGERSDAVLRTAMPGHDASVFGVVRQ